MRLDVENERGLGGFLDPAAHFYVIDPTSFGRDRQVRTAQLQGEVFLRREQRVVQERVSVTGGEEQNALAGRGLRLARETGLTETDLPIEFQNAFVELASAVGDQHLEPASVLLERDVAHHVVIPVEQAEPLRDSVARLDDFPFLIAGLKRERPLNGNVLLGVLKREDGGFLIELNIPGAKHQHEKVRGDDCKWVHDHIGPS